MKKYYRVEFETKIGGYQHWAIDIAADNLKQAKEAAQQMWTKEAHMFHVRARVIKDTEEILYNYFKRI